jgi:predicted RND superfamily exporter protein
MRTLVTWLATIVRKAPAVTIISILAATAAFGAFAPQVEMTTGIEVFVPDNPELRALDTIEEEFGTSEANVQVLVESAVGDVITSEGLQVAQRVEAAIRAMDPAVPLADSSDQPIVGYLTPTLEMAQFMGLPVGSMTDADVKTMFSSSAALVPEDEQTRFRSLLSTTSTDWEAAETGTGLMVIFLDTSGLDFSALQDLEARVATAVDRVQVGTTTATAFSEDLLLDIDPLSNELVRLFSLAAAAIVLILASVYWIRPKARRNAAATLRRTVADLGLTLAAIGISLIWVFGVGVLLGPRYLGVIDDFSPVLQVLPVLLIGLGVDFAIHLTARYREELGAGRDVATSAQRATATVGIALILATVTTAVGFLTNVANPIPPVRDFGILAAAGIVGAFLIALTFVPAARALLDCRAERKGTLPRDEFERPERRLIPRLMGKLALVAEHFAVPTLVLALALTALGAYGMAQLPTEFNSTDFVPGDDPLAVASETLATEFRGGFGETVDVLVTGEVMTAGFHNALLAGTENLASTAAVITADGQAFARSPLSVIASLLQPGPAGSPADPEFADLAAANGLRADLTVSDDADVAAIYRAALQAAPDQMAAVLASGDPPPDGFARIIVSIQPGEQGDGDLAEEITADLIPVSDLPGVTVTVTSVGIMANSVVTALQDSQSTSLAITLAAAMLLLVVSFWTESRRPFLGVITILPVVFVVLWTFGVMALLGIPFGPVTAMTSALAIGIGVPYSIHITHRYLEDRARLDDPEEAMRSTTAHTGGALLGSALTTLAGFGVLMTSGLTAFRQFGAVTTIAITFSLVAAVGVLPSMLALWDRWHTRRGQAPSGASPPPAASSRR